MSPMPNRIAAAPTTHSWLSIAPVKAIAGEVTGVVAGAVAGVDGVVVAAEVTTAAVTVPGTYVME